MCVRTVTATEVGRAQLAAETTAARVAAWFTADLWAAAVCGAIAAVAAAAARSPRARRAAAAAGIAAHLALAVALAASVQVYELYGTPPSWQLWLALEGGESSASVLAFVDLRAALRIAAFAALALGGSRVLARALAGRPRTRRAIAGAAASALAVVSGAAAVAPPSPLALDRDPLWEFTASTLQLGDALSPLPASGTFADALAPVAPRAREPRPATPAYRRLQQFGRRRPNVVLVVMESMAARHIDAETAPNLDRLRRRALVWPRHYAHQPRSMNSLYSILCANHVQPFTQAITYDRPRIDCRSVSEVLTEAGYRAGLFHSGTFNYTRKIYFLAERGYQVLYDAVTMPGAGDRYRPWGWGLEERGAIDALLAWVADGDRDRPFFATYIPVYPHHPYPVPDAAYERFGTATPLHRYRNSVLYVDAMLGELVDGLRALGVEDDTLIVLVGDHGEAFGEHPGSKTHGGKLYEEQVHTFAMWYAPGALDRGHVDARAFGHVDLVPTLLDVLHLPAQPQHAGVSAARGDARPMVPLYLPRGFHGVGFVDGTMKFVFDRKTRAVELYDLEQDPGETTSLARDRPELADAYRERALAFVTAATAWQAELPDLPLAASAGAVGPEEAPVLATWRIDPAACEHDDELEVRDGVLVLRQPTQRARAVCRGVLPPVAGRVRELRARGMERVANANIILTLLWESPGGDRRVIAYGTMNGRPERPDAGRRGEYVAEMLAFGRGGAFVLEIDYKFRAGAAELSADSFRVDEVEIVFEHDGRWIGRILPFALSERSESKRHQ